MLEPEYQEVIHGRATVRQVFDIPRVGRIAGVQVTEGKALRNSKIRVKRQDEVLCDSEVSSLKRYAENVTEVSAGMECGVGVEGFRDFQENDILEFYTKEVVE
jgi:translation initiation factor IF-2